MSTPLLVQKTAKNGLRILCERVSTAPVVALQAWVGVGSADETPKEAGLAHVHEHMLFKGTSHRGVGEIAREVEAAGGEINAWTSFDETVYHITMSSRFFETGLDVLADAIQYSSFDAEELAREKEVVLEEIRRGDDQPSRRLSQRIFSTSFKQHPYGLPVIGTRKSVSSFGRKHVTDFYKKWYVPNNLTFVVAGDVDPHKAVQAVEKAFSKSRPGKIRRPLRKSEPPPRGPRFFAEVAEAGDSYTALAFPAASLLHPDAPALDVLAEILGGGEASRLFERVQAEKGLVSTVYAHAYTPKNPGLFLVGANPFTGKEKDAITAIARELAEIREHGVTDEELSRAKLNLESESVYLRETVQGRARKWGFSLLLTGDASFEERYLAAIRSLSREDIRRAAREYLRPEWITAGMIQPGTAKGKQKTAEEKKAAAGLSAWLQGNGVKRQTAARRPAKEENQPRLHTLGNGLRVVIEKNTNVPVVAFKAVWLGGSRFEPAPEAGLYHFLAEMLSRGAGERSATQIRHESEEIAGSATGVAGRNSTGVDVQCLSRFWEKGFSLLTDIALHPTFPQEEIEKVRAETIAALDRENDSLGQVLFNLLRRTLYGTHPYGFRILGERETVAKFSRGELQAAHGRALDPRRMILAAVGDVEPGRILAEIEKSFGKLKPSSGEAPSLRANFPGRPQYAEEILDRAQAHLAIGFPGTKIDAPDRFAIEALNTILSGQGGRLFLHLRDQMSLAYSVGSLAVEGIEPGLFATYIGTAPEKLSAAYGAMQEEIRRIRERPVSSQELSRAKRHLTASHAIDLQGTDARASQYALNELYGLGYEAGAHYEKEIGKVTVKDVQDVARQYLDFGRAVLAVVRPSRVASLEGSWETSAAGTGASEAAAKAGSPLGSGATGIS